MSRRPPAAWARRGVELAVAGLPGGAQERYRAEFLADLHGMSRTRQLRHVGGLLVQSWALRTEIAATEVRLERVRGSSRWVRLLLCRTGVRHRWTRQFTDDGRWTPQHTEDGGRYQRCSRCGKDLHVGIGHWAAGGW